MFILKKGHQPGVYVPLRAFFLLIKWHGGSYERPDYNERYEHVSSLRPTFLT